VGADAAVQKPKKLSINAVFAAKNRKNQEVAAVNR